MGSTAERGLDFLLLVSSGLTELQLIVLQVLTRTTVSLSYIVVPPRNLALTRFDGLNHTLSIPIAFIHHPSQIGREFAQFGPPFSQALLIEALAVVPTDLPKDFWSEEKPYIGSVKAFLPDGKSGTSFLIRVVEIDKRHVHSLGCFLEEMMVKTTHFPTFVLTLP